MNLLFILFTLFILFIIFLCFSRKNIERYSGPVKNIKMIPKNECYNICQQHHTKCIFDFGSVPDGKSLCNRNYDVCKRVCDYSNFHRV